MEYMIVSNSSKKERERSGLLSGLINGCHCWSSVLLCVAVWKQG